MLPDRVSNPGPLAYESGAVTALKIIFVEAAFESTNISAVSTWCVSLECLYSNPFN